MYGSLFEDVVTAIGEWQPRKRYRKETTYRDKLRDFLIKKLNSSTGLFGPSERVIVKKESGRHLCDIAVNEKIGIELKRNLNKLSKVDRLAGQLGRFKKDYTAIIIVLVGKTKTNTAEELYERINELRERDEMGVFGGSTRFKIIDKGSKVSKKKKSSSSGLSLFGESAGLTNSDSDFFGRKKGKKEENDLSWF